MRTESQQKVHLIYGVTRDLDLVQVDAIEAYVSEAAELQLHCTRRGRSRVEPSRTRAG